MISTKENSWEDPLKMLSIKQEPLTSSAAAATGGAFPAEDSLVWDTDLYCELLEMPSSEFFSIASEFEPLGADILAGQLGSSGSGSGSSWCSTFNAYSGDSLKTQIRNHDCMWSGTCFDRSHPGKSCGGSGSGCGDRQKGSSGGSSSGGAEQSHQHQQDSNKQFNTVTAVAAASLNSNVAVVAQKLNHQGSIIGGGGSSISGNGILLAGGVTGSSLLTSSNSTAANGIVGSTNGSLVSGSSSSSSHVPKISSFKAAQIPAGRSLLINPRNKQQQQAQVSRVPTVSTSDFLRERDSGALTAAGVVVSSHHRPDTPLSLDEDPPEFKHTIDLATCTTTGSNRISLTGGSGGGVSARSRNSSFGGSSYHHSSHHQQHHNQHHHHHHGTDYDASSHRIINILKEHLEDTENGSLLRPSYLTNSTGEIGSLTDLLHDLEEIDAGDEDDSGAGDEIDSDASSSSDDSSSPRSRSRSSSSKHSSLAGSGSNSGGGGYTHAHHSSSSSYQQQEQDDGYSGHHHHQAAHVGDHSYTLPKNRYVDEFGVPTPSDSEEEEIDVVSIGEKNLPTNPSARDKRALQTRVANKIRKQAQQQQQQAPGASGHHHRRRHSDDVDANSGADYHHLHHHHHHHHPSGGSSQSSTPSKAAYLTPASSTGTNTPLPAGGSSSSNPRKRPNSSGKNRHHQQQHRSKKQRSIAAAAAAGAGSSSKKSTSSGGSSPSSSGASSSGVSSAAANSSSNDCSSEQEQETLEKRNLHNDMERQRRIGLKNLFEELKREIPSLRDKERAPKVNILREAASLCQRLNREQEQLNALRKQQQRLFARVRQLRTSLHTQRRTVMD